MRLARKPEIDVAEAARYVVVAPVRNDHAASRSNDPLKLSNRSNGVRNVMKHVAGHDHVKAAVWPRELICPPYAKVHPVRDFAFRNLQHFRHWIEPGKTRLGVLRRQPR